MLIYTINNSCKHHFWSSYSDHEKTYHFQGEFNLITFPQQLKVKQSQNWSVVGTNNKYSFLPSIIIEIYEYKVAIGIKNPPENIIVQFLPDCILKFVLLSIAYTILQRSVCPFLKGF